MQKEILTPSCCEEDLFRMLEHKRRMNLLRSLLWAVLTAGCIGAIYSFRQQLVDPLPLILGGTLCLVSALLAVVIAIPAVRNLRLRRQIYKNGYEIREDLLTVILAEWVKGSRRVPGMYVYCLRFENSEEYRIPPYRHYEWSETRVMLPREVHDTAAAGDRYYVVYMKNDPRKSPLMVYNQKFFILCEEGTTRAHTSWKDSVSLE